MAHNLGARTRALVSFPKMEVLGLKNIFFFGLAPYLALSNISSHLFFIATLEVGVMFRDLQLRKLTLTRHVNR